MEDLLTGLRAMGESTRLRLLALCAQGDLTVTEITQILGQSQPRVSRHLKVMCEGGLLTRFREGAWVFYRLCRQGPGGALAQAVLPLLPAQDAVLLLDRERLGAIKRTRAEAAEAYFRDNAAHWDKVRALHVDESEVERALCGLLGDGPLGDVLDVGTGTGQLLIALAGRVHEAVGLDLSREMLAIARTHLEAAGLSHCSVRQGDMYHLPFSGPSFDLVAIHQVLHYADDPAAVVAEAARVLRPGGRLVVVDFAPHEVEALRHQHNHRRLGFSGTEIAELCQAARLQMAETVDLPGHPLTVSLWLARSPQSHPKT